MTPNDIPTSITKLVYTAPWIGDPPVAAMKLSQNEAAAQLAHYWPAIEAHIREQVAQEIEAALARNLAEYPDLPAMGAHRLGLNHAARIARIAAQPTAATED